VASPNSILDLLANNLFAPPNAALEITDFPPFIGSPSADFVVCRPRRPDQLEGPS
jgi:hypothetical protein